MELAIILRVSYKHLEYSKNDFYNFITKLMKQTTTILHIPLQLSYLHNYCTKYNICCTDNLNFFSTAVPVQFYSTIIFDMF